LICRSSKLPRPRTFGRVLFPFHPFSLCLIVLGCWCLTAITAVAQIDTSDSQLSHVEFVQKSLLTLAEEALAGIDTAERRDLRFLPAFADSANYRVEAAFAAYLPPTDSGKHVLRYRVDFWDFSLVKKTRRWFLGRFWVLRELRVGMTITYPPALSMGKERNVNFDQTSSGWVRAADLGRLESGEFSSLPVPPASDFVSRWTAPIVVGAGLGALTFLFFSVR